ncbi:Rossmann-fold NAD(P)-binding domain-containing protein [Flavobacterium restrictum]|uniref:SDR family NAD(P)-dependent oxidoreductase n=1 Tax=Flavobacterium restrictum TaxID=2594428 RepID=A0A553DVB0_9FLAO|nr:SDR family NAD(P)-dependent oxidoreductase [Flavobacterium restrictum]TRX36724.1 SDR family NAD(P)-dependent oxidoreductase [Flavobacterium restrictum]
MTQISILGCGWLGLPLAKALLEKGCVVKGSTTSPEKLSMLENSGIQPYLIALSEEEIAGNCDGFLENSKILIIDVPPKLRGSNTNAMTSTRKTFVEKIKNTLPFIEKSSIECVLFISSTSVYGDGNQCTVTEETKTGPDTEGGKQLVEVEQLLQKNTAFKTTILRFGGLIGEDRNPVKFLAGRENIENPTAPINLIHQDDCIGIVLKILETNSWGNTFNAVSPFHPTREAYYTQKAIAMDLALPKFNHSQPSVGKTIGSDKVSSVLKYTFVQTTL